ncbi:MAG: nucleotidyltransferase family protein [Planctomycetaceae bacterium]
MPPVLKDFSWDRMIAAVEAVKERMLRAANALEQAGIPYAVAGGNAVAAWVSRVDQAAVRNTQDVDILVRRSDFEAVKAALESVGFRHRHVASIDCFLDQGSDKVRDAVHLLYADEKVRAEYPLPSPTVDDVDRTGGYRIVSFEGLLQMKFNSYRDKDRTHLRDMIEVGLLDQSWLTRLIPEHAVKLQELLDNPDG